ncbi:MULTISPECIES: non-ribosomal peptide synthetase [Kamptonema]|uniref:non-ribosomal peptide synthetase n=1 Tax=Kamptonema TaxID=1501433 RepID=UPI0001DACB9E|nr:MULTISPECIES: non-ribosomal peptide synthetase [Kamptonema]CBN59214.1 amino acid adenylation [Kamptonema sp. PCC 6506]
MSDSQLNQKLNSSIHPSQTDKTLSVLKEIVGKAMGVSSSEIDDRTNFLELGFESVQLLQINGAIKKAFGLNISLKLLIENSSTINELAVYISQQMPSIEPTLTPDRPETNNSKPKKEESLLPEKYLDRQTDNTAIKRLMAQQLEVMSKQLEFLRENISPKQKQPTRIPTETIEPERPKQIPIQNSKSKIQNFPSSANLTPRQKEHLDALIARVIERTQASKNLTQNDRVHHANSRSVLGFRPSIKEMVYPIYPQRSSGARIWDIDGNEYIDMSMGFGALLFGHSPSFIINAIQDYVHQGIQHGPQSALAGKAAQLVCELTGQERACFCNDGSEAVMGAIRIARAITGREKIAFFAGSYHGTLDEVLVAGVPSEDGKLRSIAIAPGIPQHKVEQVIVLDYGNPKSLDIIRSHASELAAILVEPIQSAKPDLQPKEFLHELRQLTQEMGIVLIFDEVITGFRMHPGGMQALWNIRADITTYGKAIGGGMPIGVIAGKATFMDALDGGFWSYGDASYPEVEVTHFAGTFFKHPLVMAATLAALTHLKNSGAKLQEELTTKTIKLVNTLNTYFEQKQLPIQVVHFGSLFRFAYSPTLNWMDLFFYHLLEKGIFALENRRLFLSTAHTDEDIERMIQAVKESISEMQEGGFLPPEVLCRGSAPVPAPNPKGATTGGLPLQENETALPREGGLQTLPLTEAQKELWVMAQMGENVSRAYNQSTTIHLRGSFNLVAARKAIQEVVDRHEALGATFSPSGDYQQINSTLTINIPVVDFSTLDDSDRATHLEEFLATEARQTFNLETGPLVRTQIVKLEEKHHLLVLTVHHIIADGWSLGVLQQELAAIYTAEWQAIAHQLPQPMQLSEYVQWEASQQESAKMAKAEAYWLQQFSSSVPVLELPTDRPRPSVNRYVGTRQSFILDTSFYDALKNASIKFKSTLFTTALAGFLALLHRLTGQEDIVIGIPSAGQLSVEGESLVGHYVNLLPIRSQVGTNPTFTQYLSSIKQVLSDAYDHQIYPFIRLVKKLNLPRDTSRPPLVTILFNWDRPMATLESFSQKVEFVRNTTNSSISDIFLDIHQQNDELVVDCEYNTDLFDSQTIERWMKHWQTLLESIFANPEQRVWDLPLLKSPEIKQLLLEWNDTQTDYPQHCIHELFEAQVECTPDAVAVMFENQSLTYRELNAKANQLAHYLQKLGVNSEVIVGICLERSLDPIVAILGVLKAGGAYLPLDPNYPQERLDFMLSDAQLSVLITHSSLVKNFPKMTVLCLDTDWEIIQQESQENPVNSSTIDNVAYVIYTSGSTGKPKGVLGLHRGAINRFYWMWQTYPFKEEEVCCQKTSLNFVDSVWEIFGPLLQGIRTIIISDRILKDPHQFVETLANNQVTRLVLVPSLLRLLLDTFADLQKRLPKLNFWVTSGETLSVELLQKFQQILPKSTLLNLYGSSEVSADVTCYNIDPQNKVNSQVLIGRAIANTQIYVLDKNLQPVPIGIPGELYVGGAGLARGYLNRPELTLERFIPNPLASVHTELSTKLYKTGDLVRYLPDGNLEFLGRIDNQVKIRGFRIELGEIEAVLAQHPSVRQVIVLARENEINNQQLVAYLISDPEQAIAVSELHRLLQEKLPNYMIPSAFIVLETLPLLPNGKVDCRALPALEQARPKLEAAYQAPRTEIEQTIAAIWQEFLHLEEVGIQDNFFDLGGDSLLLVRVHSQMQKIFQREFSLVGMFQYPTIGYLAEYLIKEENKQRSYANNSQSSITPTDSINRRRQVRQEHRAARQRRE